MSLVTLSASWTDKQLQRLVDRRKRYAIEEAELLNEIKSFTPEMWKQEDYRWIGKELKDQVKYCQQNVKCCTMLLEFFHGKISAPKVGTEMKAVFLLCCCELEYGYINTENVNNIEEEN